MKSPSLTSAAALTMSWSAPLYTTGAAAEFIRQLDLSPAFSLLEQCNNVCQWYGEVILNRKHFIREWITRQIAASSQTWQIVIPAAGMSPLSLELLESYPDRISHIIEYDLEGMDEKKRLYDLIAPGLSNRIRCLKADMSLTSASQKIARQHGFDMEQPTLIAIEGISYYLPAVSLKNLVACFHTPSGQNQIIIEYLMPASEIADERRSIPDDVFGIIEQKCGITDIRRYSQTEMSLLFDAAHGCAEQHAYMREMELLRTGGNLYFPSDRDGWTSVTAGRI